MPDLVRPTVLKIDIEGAEILALQGAQRLLRAPDRPRLLFVEAHPEFLPTFGGNLDQLSTLMTDAGYQVLSTRRREDQLHLIALNREP
jgi:hypothetical protein